MSLNSIFSIEKKKCTEGVYAKPKVVPDKLRRCMLGLITKTDFSFTSMLTCELQQLRRWALVQERFVSKQTIGWVR